MKKKRKIKLLMSIGFSRNEASELSIFVVEPISFKLFESADLCQFYVNEFERVNRLTMRDKNVVS